MSTVNAIADLVKYHYFTINKELADMQSRLAELTDPILARAPAWMDEATRRSPELTFTPQRYAKAQETLDRALRFDPETRARFGDQT
jgi:hypothetical protein